MQLIISREELEGRRYQKRNYIFPKPVAHIGPHDKTHQVMEYMATSLAYRCLQSLDIKTGSLFIGLTFFVNNTLVSWGVFNANKPLRFYEESDFESRSYSNLSGLVTQLALTHLLILDWDAKGNSGHVPSSSGSKKADTPIYAFDYGASVSTNPYVCDSSDNSVKAYRADVQEKAWSKPLYSLWESGNPFVLLQKRRSSDLLSLLTHFVDFSDLKFPNLQDAVLKMTTDDLKAWLQSFMNNAEQLGKTMQSELEGNLDSIFQRTNIHVKNEFLSAADQSPQARLLIGKATSLSLSVNDERALKWQIGKWRAVAKGFVDHTTRVRSSNMYLILSVLEAVLIVRLRDNTSPGEIPLLQNKKSFCSKLEEMSDTSCQLAYLKGFLYGRCRALACDSDQIAQLMTLTDRVIQSFSQINVHALRPLKSRKHLSHSLMLSMRSKPEKQAGRPVSPWKAQCIFKAVCKKINQSDMRFLEKHMIKEGLGARDILTLTPDEFHKSPVSQIQAMHDFYKTNKFQEKKAAQSFAGFGSTTPL